MNRDWYIHILLLTFGLCLSIYIVLAQIQFLKVQLFDLRCYVRSGKTISEYGETHLFKASAWECVDIEPEDNLLVKYGKQPEHEEERP